MNQRSRWPLVCVAAAVAIPHLARAAEDESAWQIATPKYGSPRGQTTVEVHFPKAVSGAPVTFGIPLGQVVAPDRIVMRDEQGQAVPAGFVPLGDWSRQPQRWALVSCVLSSDRDASTRTLALSWGNPGPETKTLAQVALKPAEAIVSNGTFQLSLSPQGIKGITLDGKRLTFDTWQPAFVPKGGRPLSPRDGKLVLLRDGAVHKKVRITSSLSDALDLQQEFDVCAGSPFVRCSVRFINRTVKDLPLDGIVPIEATLRAARRVRVGLAGDDAADARRFTIRQRAFGWSGEMHDPDVSRKGAHDDLGEWVAAEFDGGARLLWCFPRFQEMAAGDDDLESALTFDGERLRLQHYRATGAKADVRLRETMARTFTYWIVVDPPSGHEARLAAAVKAMPHVVYDRTFLTAMGVFPERTVSRLFDAPALEAALYFKRAQVPRPEYVRCGRGTDPGPDKSGEGMYEVDLHAGGMVFGEVFQYSRPKPDAALLRVYCDEIGVDRRHVLTGGKMAYRNGDIPLALYLGYLRFGNRTLHDFARIHTQLFADYGLSHARGASAGIGHYYCDWYGNPYVYQRFEGLLLGYLITGEPWWLESATAMADFCVRAWKDGHPRDASISGGLGGVQTRSAYIAKMLLRLYDVTGRREYADTAVRLAKWIIPYQEPEGWWCMGVKHNREFRCTPIFAGYLSQGLWPVYFRTHNKDLLDSLLRAVDFFISKQEDVRGHNPGTFPNSYWYGKHIKASAPIEGNYATTSQWADNIFQAYLATGRKAYFYSANAAWLGVLSHQTPEGGVPLSNDPTNSVWSHVMVECLPAFAAVAERRGLPMVLSAKTGAGGASFMGKGATFDGREFAVELKYRHDRGVPVRVFYPRGKPAEVLVNDAPLAYTYDAAQRIVRLELPATRTFHTTRIRVR